MFGMIGFIPDLREVDVEEPDEDPAAWNEDDVTPGDIVEVATRHGKPVLAKSQNYDDKAQLRVLGSAQGDRIVYVMLVTQADVEHVKPNTRVDKRMLHDYGIEKRFLGEDAIVVSDFHMRRIVKQQRGRWCEKCDEYNEEVRTDYSEVYFCPTCRDNPWR